MKILWTWPRGKHSRLRVAKQCARGSKSLLLGLATAILLLAAPARAQRLLDFQYTDSLTLALQAQQRWAALDSVGEEALRLGVEYPALHRRLGQAKLNLGQTARAIRHYSRALHADPLDSTARYGLVLAHLALNQREQAAFHAPGLTDSLRRQLHLGGFYAVNQAEVEASGQQTSSTHRRDAGFLRLGLGSQLGSRLSLAQSVSFFNQGVQGPPPSGPPRREPPPFITISQWEYHALLGVQLSARWRAKLSYHYLHSYYGSDFYPSYLAYGALSYTRPYWTAQAGLYTGLSTDTVRTQADLRLTVYPLGNLRLYGFGRGSLIFSGGRTYPNTLLGAGARLRPWLWAEAYGSLGLVPVLAEADGTYVFNLFDQMTRRGGVSLHILLPHSLALRLHYIAEQRIDRWDQTDYNLYSLTAALAWTW
jgi:tetratricopeptide (TPR) repeat protein